MEIDIKEEIQKAQAEEQNWQKTLQQLDAQRNQVLTKIVSLQGRVEYLQGLEKSQEKPKEEKPK